MGESITQKVTFEKWPEGKSSFDTPGDLLACVEDLAQQGYRGQVRVFHINESLAWDLEINGENIQPVNVVLGQVVVLFGSTLEAMTPEQYAARFA